MSETVELESVTRVSSGIERGGQSYTKWQGEPPSHAIFMAKTVRVAEDGTTDETYTTIKAYDLTERVAHDEEMKLEDGADGPGNRPFKHDVDLEDLPQAVQEEIKDEILASFYDE